MTTSIAYGLHLSTAIPSRQRAPSVHTGDRWFGSTWVGLHFTTQFHPSRIHTGNVAVCRLSPQCQAVSTQQAPSTLTFAWNVDELTHPCPRPPLACTRTRPPTAPEPPCLLGAGADGAAKKGGARGPSNRFGPGGGFAPKEQAPAPWRRGVGVGSTLCPHHWTGGA